MGVLLHGRKAKLDREHPHTIDTPNHLIKLYETWGKIKEAEEWRTELIQKNVEME